MARHPLHGRPRPAIAGHVPGSAHWHIPALLVLAGMTWVGFFGLLAYSAWLAGAGAGVSIAVVAIAIVPGALALIAGGIGGLTSRGR